MEEFAFQRALAAIWELIGGVNRYVDAQAPWALAKDPGQARAPRAPCSTRSASRCAASASCSIRSCPTPRRRSAAAIGAPAPSARRSRLGPPRRRHPRHEALRALPAIDVGATSRSADSGDEAARADGEAASGEAFPSTTSRRWISAWPRCSPPRRCRSPRSSSSSRVKVGEETRTLVAGIAEHYDPGDLVGPQGRDRGQPRARHPHGHRVQRHGAGRLPARARSSLLTLDKDVPPGAKVK